MFFDSSSFAAPQVTLGHFSEWANSIATSYLKHGIEPTTSLRKLAQSAELTPPQIETVAGEANKLIHQQKYASAKNKYLAADFPHADARAALASLQVGSVKTATVLPPPQLAVESWDEFAVWGVDRPSQVKTAELKGEMKHAALRTELVRNEIRDQEIMTKQAAENAERAFIKTARQCTLEDGSSAERMKTLGGIFHATKCAGLDGKRQLAKVAYVLGKEGMLTPAHAETALKFFLSKEADCKAPPELISEWLQARVVNGNHPLFITLKTYHDHQARMGDHRGRSSIVDDRLQILRQKVRAL